MANDDERSIADYVREGERRALSLDNRGPIRFDREGAVERSILDAYREYGFYVFEDVLEKEELEDLRSDLDRVFERAPVTKGATVDSEGRPALGSDLEQPVYRFARPLSDPVGGTSANNGRHPAKMAEPKPPPDAPDYVISSIGSPLHVMDAALRLYGHPLLLRIAEQINGPDFTPFTESVILKVRGLGTSVAWHQDGTTLWDRPDWDEESHGFNFMAQLYGSTAENGVWVVPGSHKLGKIDIRARVAESGSDRLPDAVPMVCGAGGIVMANRQTLHGSFANTSKDRRMTINFGFHQLSSVLGVRRKTGEGEVVYDTDRIAERSRLISLAIDARSQRFPQEERYTYQPLAGREDENRWSEETRETILKNYNLRDLGL